MARSEVGFGRLVGSALVVMVGCSAAAGAQVDVNSGEALSEADLLAGMFNGTNFTLTPGTVFNINSGGVMERVGSSFPDPFVPFSFGGASIIVNGGGALESGTNDRPGPRSAVADAAIVAHTNSVIQESFYARNTSLELRGGQLERGVDFEAGSHIEMFGGFIDRDFEFADGSTMIMHGGRIGNNPEADLNSHWVIHSANIGTSLGVRRGSTLDFYNGFIGNNGTVSDSTLNMYNGRIAEDFTISGSTVANIHGGAIGDDFRALSGTTLNVFGGRFDGDLFVGTTTNIRSGTFADIIAGSSTELNLFVRELSIDGVEIEIDPFGTIEITQRQNSLLEAVLADGSFFDLRLSTSLTSDDRVQGILNVTSVVPGPSSAVSLGFAGLLVLRRRRNRGS